MDRCPVCSGETLRKQTEELKQQMAQRAAGKLKGAAAEFRPHKNTVDHLEAANSFTTFRDVYNGDLPTRLGGSAAHMDQLRASLDRLEQLGVSGETGARISSTYLGSSRALSGIKQGTLGCLLRKVFTVRTSRIRRRFADQGPTRGGGGPGSARRGAGPCCAGGQSAAAGGGARLGRGCPRIEDVSAVHLA